MVEEYSRDASQLANEYYDTVRLAWQQEAGVDMPAFANTDLIDPDRALWQVQGGFSNTDYNGLTYKQVKEGRSHAGATIDDLWPDLNGVDDWQQFIADMIHTSARLTMQRDIRLDPTRPRWARVPHGKTCAFCLMLASRGFKYTSEEAAGGEGNYYHADCRCTPIPNWGEQKLSGYDPDRLSDMWDEAGRAAGGKADYKAKLAALRRLHADELTDGVTAKPHIRWSHKPIAPSADELERLGDFTMRMPEDRYSDKEKVEALRAWTGSSFAEINDALFGSRKMTKSIRGRIAPIDEALNDHVVQSRFTVDRQMDLRFFDLESVQKVMSLEVGKTIRHKGYIATSLNEGGEDTGESERIATRILVPSGSHAVFLRDISSHPEENEILLPRESELVIEAMGRLGNSNAPVVYLRLV